MGPTKRVGGLGYCKGGNNRTTRPGIAITGFKSKNCSYNGDSNERKWGVLLVG